MRVGDEDLAEYERVDGPGHRILVRRDYRWALEELGFTGGAVVPDGYTAGGRAAHPIVRLSRGEWVVIRRYRRGGLLRHLNRDRYFLGHRAIAESRATARAAAGGVRVPLVVAALERRSGIGYTAALATRWIEGVQEAAAWLAGAGPDARLAMLSETGEQIARMHAAGVAHPDLNLRNLLVGTSSDELTPTVHLIDFDRARLYASPVPEARRRRDLLRLHRSTVKLKAAITPVEWTALRTGYGADWPPSTFPE